jgi:hypothetical protein
VVVAEPVMAPRVLERRRIELAAVDVPRPVQPYHAAQKLSLAEAEALVGQFSRQAQLLAEVAIREAIERLGQSGFKVVGCGVPLGSGRSAPSLEAALASHPMLHTAEGELFRHALIQASEKCGLQVLAIRERGLVERGAKEMGISPGALTSRLSGLGHGMGPPWGQDQKLAALVAWLALW